MLELDLLDPFEYELYPEFDDPELLLELDELPDLFCVAEVLLDAALEVAYLTAVVCCFTVTVLL